MILSTKEKNLIILLATVILLGVYINFLLLPQIDHRKEIEIVKMEKVELVDEIKEYADPNTQIHADFRDLLDKINQESSEYFPELNQERLILILDNMIKESQVKTTALVFSGISVSELEVFSDENGEVNSFPLKDMSDSYRSKDSETKVNKAQTGVLLEKMEVNIQTIGNYENTIDLMNKIEKYQRRIHISRINLKDNKDGQVTSNMVISFYGIPKLMDQDQEYLVWKIFDVYGRNNPFRY